MGKTRGSTALDTHLHLDTGQALQMGKTGSGTFIGLPNTDFRQHSGQLTIETVKSCDIRRS